MGLKSYAYSFLKWMLALAFVFAIYMFIQVVVAGFGGTVIGVIAALASGGFRIVHGGRRAR